MDEQPMGGQSQKSASSKGKMSFTPVDVAEMEGSSDDEAMDFEAMKRRVESNLN